MKTKLAPVVAGALAAVWFTPVLPASAKDFCNVPKGQWQPQSSLFKKLEGQGWKIRNLKINSGCYEVYGTDGSGKSRETHFNPATLQPVADGHKSY